MIPLDEAQAYVLDGCTPLDVTAAVAGEALGLVYRVVQLGERVRNLPAVDDKLEAIDPEGVAVPTA